MSVENKKSDSNERLGLRGRHLMAIGFFLGYSHEAGASHAAQTQHEIDNFIEEQKTLQKKIPQLKQQLAAELAKYDTAWENRPRDPRSADAIMYKAKQQAEYYKKELLLCEKQFKESSESPRTFLYNYKNENRLKNDLDDNMKKLDDYIQKLEKQSENFLYRYMNVADLRAAKALREAISGENPCDHTFLDQLEKTYGKSFLKGKLSHIHTDLKITLEEISKYKNTPSMPWLFDLDDEADTVDLATDNVASHHSL